MVRSSGRDVPCLRRRRLIESSGRVRVALRGACGSRCGGCSAALQGDARVAWNRGGGRLILGF